MNKTSYKMEAEIYKKWVLVNITKYRVVKAEIIHNMHAEKGHKTQIGASDVLKSRSLSTNFSYTASKSKALSYNLKLSCIYTKILT